MPSLNKTFHFLASSLATAASVAFLGYGMSTTWVISTMECSQKDAENFNGSAKITFGIFNGVFSNIFCPSFSGDKVIEVLEQLGSIGGGALILHGLVLALLVFSLLCSAGSILISLYNSFSNPYQTYMGPVGVYTCSSGSATMSTLALVLFVVNVYTTEISEKIVLKNASADLRHVQITLQMGLYFLIPYMGLSLLSILVVYLYEHMAYVHREQQQRPTEDAPKEIMMY